MFILKKDLAARTQRFEETVMGPKRLLKGLTPFDREDVPLHERWVVEGGSVGS